MDEYISLITVPMIALIPYYIIVLAIEKYYKFDDEDTHPKDCQCDDCTYDIE